MLWPERPQERLYWWGWSAHGQCGAKADRVAVARAPAELTAPGPLRDAAASRDAAFLDVRDPRRAQRLDVHPQSV